MKFFSLSSVFYKAAFRTQKKDLHQDFKQNPGTGPFSELYLIQYII